MTEFEAIKQKLEKKKLLGFMPLTSKQYPKGDWDNAIALYLQDFGGIEVLILRTQNADYSCYDDWIIEESAYIERNDTYKSIGEEISSVQALEIENWTLNEDQIQFKIITNTKVLNFGHHWNDCHYPNSIWDEISK